MSLAKDLRDQAESVAGLDPRRPKQATLRRALSTAYYALFHFLIEAATQRVMGTDRAFRPYRWVLARGYDHGQMANVCRSFAGGTLPSFVTDAIGPQAVPPELRQVARTFTRLQEQRHQADYDLTARFSKADVMLAVRSVDHAIAAWGRVRTDPLAKLFLALLTTYNAAKSR